MNFSGSYRSADVTFLLAPRDAHAFVGVDEKERLIQSGQRHYGELLSAEAPPSQRYMDVFKAACEMHGARMALDCLRLASLVSARRPGQITLVSLARGGTPVGVVLVHLLRDVFERSARHYSLSVIRDRGVDEAALRHILAHGSAPESIVFVDGWTGKGTIARELQASVASFNTANGTAIDPGLHVLSDIAGVAACAASADDYLIPSSILNATVSGLISRTVLDESVGPGQFHACVLYDHLADIDQSQSFVNGIVRLAKGLSRAKAHAFCSPADPVAAAVMSRRFTAWCAQRYNVDDLNLIKPGIGETTRALLRRRPRLLLVRDTAVTDVAHLLVLAEELDVPVATMPALAYQAAALVRKEADA